jgi:cytochrome b pre-mRNA-processing protein 3
MLQSLFRPRPARAMGQKLYAAAVAQARQAELYSVVGVKDEIDSRFELYTAHVVLLLLRLKGEGEEAGEVGQALFDAYIHALDDALRELGVGDLSVSKKMRRLGETLYARSKQLTDALEADAEPGALETAVGEAFFADDVRDARTARLAAYIRSARDGLSILPLREVLDGNPRWPQIKA